MFIPGAQISIQIGHAVKWICARNAIVKGSGKGRILPIERPLSGPCADINLHAAFRVLKVEIAGQRQVKRFARFPQELPAQPQIILAVHQAVFGKIADQAISAGRGQCKARGHHVRQRAGNRGLGLLEAKIANADFRFGLRRKAGLACRDGDGPRRRVLAIKRALRAAQYLHSLYIVEVERRRRDAIIINLVNVKTDTLFNPVIGQPKGRANAADIDRCIAGVGGEKLHTGLQLRQARQVVSTGLFNRLRIDNRDRDGHILHLFGSASGRHDNSIPGVKGIGALIDRLIWSSKTSRRGKNRESGAGNEKRLKHECCPF